MLKYENNPEAPALELISTADLSDWMANAVPINSAWVSQAGFEAQPNQFVFLPAAHEEPNTVLVGFGDKPSIESIGALPSLLPPGAYQLNTENKDIILGWGLGAYRFESYKTTKTGLRELYVGSQHVDVEHEISAVGISRDLINTPTSDMLPHDLEGAARKIAIKHNATIEVTTGDELLLQKYNTIHAVGRASISSPRLIDLQWGPSDGPSITLVGKGVCFDSGGLNIKPASNMRSMKKDMGGAATVLGLADLIMAKKLPIRLRVLVPAVENAIAGNAFRPGDVLTTYLGKTVEIDNTDAEGRLILCDALALAVEENPDLLIDFATLTGAARSALGTELPAMFSNDDSVANDLIASGKKIMDPLWRMPLHEEYRYLLNSKIADIVNSASTPYGGAITAALFLKEFVGNVPWVHFDVMGWNLRSRPAHPEGGEAMGLRAVYQYLSDRFA